MEKIYLYELINLLGTVEYVGITSNVKSRSYQHLKAKPNKNLSRGRFYKRQDLFLNVVDIFDNRSEAWKAEGELKKLHNIPWTEFDVCSKNGSEQGLKNVNSGLLKSNSEKLKGKKIEENSITRGEKIGTSKLTKDEVVMIKIKIQEGQKDTSIAKEFRVSRTNISYIRRGKAWSWV